MMIIENDLGTMILHGINLGMSLIRGIEKLEGRHPLKLMIIIEVHLETIILRGINLGKILPRVMRRLKSCYRTPMLKDRITCSVEFRGIVLRQNVFRPK